MRGSGDVEVDVDADVEEVVEVEGTKPSPPVAIGEPVALVFETEETEAERWGGNGGGTCWN